MIRKINNTSIVSSQSKVDRHKRIELLKFAGTAGNLTYGFMFGNMVPYFITNKTALEEDLPLLSLPVVIDDVYDHPIVFIDLRPILKGKFNETKPLRDNVSDVTIFDAILLELYYISYYNHSNDILSMSGKVAEVMGGALSFNLGQGLMLNIDEINDLQIVITYKLLSMYTILDSNIKRDMVANMKLLKTDPDTVEKLVDGLSDELTISSLCEDIKNADISTKTNKMDIVVLQTTIKSLVFGVYPSSIINLSLQHLPTAIGLLYLVDNGRLYKKTKLKYYIDNSRKITGIDDIVQRAEADLKIVNTNLTSEDDAYNLAETVNNPFVEILALEQGMLMSSTDPEGNQKLRLYIHDVWFEDNELTRLVNELVSYPKDTELHIILDSRGGIINDGLRLLNTIRNHFTNIITSIDNTAKSMATVIFAIGDKRIVYEFSDIMFHTHSGGVYGKGQEVQSKVEHGDKLYDRMNQIIVVDRGLLTQAEFEEMKIGKDFWFDSKEMLEKGIATHIIFNGKEYTAKQYLKMIEK